MKLFSHRSFAALAMLALLGLAPIKQTARAASQVPPFPIEEIKPNLAYLKNHYLQGDQLVLHPWAERAFVLYAERFGLSGLNYKVTSNFRLDPSCVYDDIRKISDEPRVWLLFYHVIDLDRSGLEFLLRVLSHSGTLKLVSTAPGSSLYEYTAGDKTGGIQLPPSAAICSEPPLGKKFFERIAERARSGNVGPQSPQR